MASKSFEIIDGLNTTGVNTFSANVIVDTDTFFVDTLADRVGINKIPTQGALDVTGDVYATTYYGDGSQLTGVAGADADTLDGLDSTNFIRSNVSDTFENGQLTVANASIYIHQTAIGITLSDNVDLGFGTGNDTIFQGNDDGVVVTGANVAFDTDTLFVDFINHRVGIEKNNPSTELDVNGTVSATNFDTTSDINKKENVSYINNGIDTVMQLKGVEFDWIATNEHSSGVIAQQIEEVLPWLVHNNGEHKSVNYNGIIGYLIEAIKEQQETINNLVSNISK